MVKSSKGVRPTARAAKKPVAPLPAKKRQASRGATRIAAGLARSEGLAPQEQALRAELLTWFDRHQRPLPWRRSRDPYGIWLSEVMLQQTQVQTVIPYWHRFLERFPTVHALANAPVDDVLSLWRGLGYYSRARNLHLAAKAISALGSFPRTATQLLELPGFGRYTAGAVASIGFGEAAPIVDGNVARVFSRLFLVEGVPGDRAREKTLWSLAEKWVQGPDPGNWNQALMELGALVCRPEAPSCLLCPVRSRCGALREARVDSLPPPRVRAARKRLELLVAVWRRGEQVLLARRSGRGLFGGLWELPSVSPAGEDASPLRELLGEVKVAPELCRVERTLTHRDLVLRLHLVTGSGEPQRLEGYDAIRWTSVAESTTLGMSTAMQKALVAAARAENGAR